MPQISLDELEVAAQSTRFEMLGLSGWFLASDAAERLHVERGTIRQHAAKLRAEHLVTRRRRGRRSAQEWRVTPRGREIRRRLLEVLGEPYEPLAEERPSFAA